VFWRSGRTRLNWRHISDNGLPAIIDVDVLDPNELVAAMPKPSKNLDLCQIGSQQPCRGRSKGCERPHATRDDRLRCRPRDHRQRQKIT
jgi:hypothetical protein